MRRGTRSNPDNGDDAAGASDAVGAGVSSSGEEPTVPQIDAVEPGPEPSPALAVAGQEKAADDTVVKPKDVEAEADIGLAEAAENIGRALVDVTNALRDVAKRSITQEGVMDRMQERLAKIEIEKGQHRAEANPDNDGRTVHEVDYVSNLPADDGNNSDLEFWYPERSEQDLAGLSGYERQLLKETPRVRRVPKSHRSRRSKRSKVEDEYDIYPVSVAYKIYKSAFENTHCKRIGDGSFFDAKRTWERLLKDFPITKPAERRLMPYAFEKDARRVYEEIASTHTEASASKLWDMLEVRLCSKTHRSALQDKFFAMKWNEKKESVAHYAERLRSAAMALPTPVDNDVLLNRFKAGLPQKLQDQAVLVMGDFDTVVSSISRLSTAQQSFHREQVREVIESAGGGPSQSSGNAGNRFAHVKCHYCSQLGHIARYCDKKKAADKANEGNARPAHRAEQGNGAGGANPPARN